MTALADGWIENRATAGWRGVDVNELWEYRDVAAILALRDLQVRYKQAVFGVAWALVQPLAGVVVFTFIFRQLAGMPSDGVAYPLFVFTGLVLWNYMAGAVTKATQCLVGNSPLVTKVYFPEAGPAAGLARTDPGRFRRLVGADVRLAGVLPGLARAGPAAAPGLAGILVAMALGIGAAGRRH